MFLFCLFVFGTTLNQQTTRDEETSLVGLQLSCVGAGVSHTDDDDDDERARACSAAGDRVDRLTM
jgi:hypothetical protein